MDDLTAARERHQPRMAVGSVFVGPDAWEWREAKWESCSSCYQPWPCDAARLRDRLDAAVAIIHAADGRISDLEQERDAARALADELAAALRTAARYIDPHYHGMTYAEVDAGDCCEVIDAALAKWETSK